MFPWEHLAVGYLAYSLSVRLWYGRPPTGTEAIAVALATQLPDLLDKPLAWELGVLPSGRSLGHSLLFVVPLVFLVLTATDRRIGVAVAVGVFLHLATDVVHPVALGSPVDWTFLLWPLLERPPVETPGAAFRTGRIFEAFFGFLAKPEGRRYLLLELLLLASGLLTWLADGRPGPGVVRSWLGRRVPSAKA